jgi:hypothetical protein
LPPYFSGALALDSAPAALPVASSAVSAVQLCHLAQIVSADIVPNVVPHDIPMHAFWRHPIMRIGVNDRQPTVTMCDETDSDGGRVGFRQRNVAGDA